MHHKSTRNNFENHIKTYLLLSVQRFPSTQLIGFTFTIIVVIVTEIIWYVLYWQKRTDIAKFESVFQVFLNMYSMPYPWIYSRCMGVKVLSSLMIPLSILIPLPPLIFICIMFVCLVKRGSVPKSDKKERTRLLAIKVVKMISNWTKIARRRKFSLKKWRVVLILYLVLIAIYLYVGIYSIFHTLFYVAIGIVLKAEMFTPYVMGVIMAVYYMNLSVQNYFTKYTRLKHSYFKQALDKCTVNARKSSVQVLQNMLQGNKDLSQWHIVRAQFKQVWLYSRTKWI